LREICFILFAPKISDGMRHYLLTLVQHHLSQFTKVFPGLNLVSIE
jgi:hypothetical protein